MTYSIFNKRPTHEEKRGKAAATGMNEGKREKKERKKRKKKNTCYCYTQSVTTLSRGEKYFSFWGKKGHV